MAFYVLFLCGSDQTFTHLVRLVSVVGQGSGVSGHISYQGTECSSHLVRLVSVLFLL